MEYGNTKGRLFDIQGYSVHDGPGIRTTVYTKGCPLRCFWCHSPESMEYKFQLVYLPVKCIGVDICQNACVKACPNGAISPSEPMEALDKSGMLQKAVVDRSLCTNCLECTKNCITKALAPSAWDTTVDEVYEKLNKDRAFFDSGGGVSICGGEPLVQFDFTYNLAKKLHENDIHVCLDTTGYAKEELIKKINPYIDLYLYDIKHMDSERHRQLTGVSNELILSNARYLSKNNGALQVRVPVIPKLTDSKENLNATAQLCVELGDAVKLVQILPYHSTGKMKYDRIGWEYKMLKLAPPSDDFMQETLQLFQSYGLNCKLY